MTWRCLKKLRKDEPIPMDLGLGRLYQDRCAITLEPHHAQNGELIGYRCPKDGSLYVERECQTCGKLFITTRAGDEHCSRKCARK